MIQSNATAPTVDIINVPKTPPALSPTRPYSQPPMILPTSPTIRLTNKPKPLPLIIRPAIAPAAIPMMIDQIIPNPSIINSLY